MTSPLGPLTRDTDSADFFDAAAAGTLVAQRCEACRSWQFPQPLAPVTQRCYTCAHGRTAWAPVTGRATLVTWTSGQAPGEQVATVVGLVELEEGPWLHAQLRDVRPEQLAAGLALTVAFEQPEGGEPLPVFRPE